MFIVADLVSLITLYLGKDDIDSQRPWRYDTGYDRARVSY